MDNYIEVYRIPYQCTRYGDSIRLCIPVYEALIYILLILLQHTLNYVQVEIERKN